MLHHIPPEQQKRLKTLVGYSSGTMLLLAALLIFAQDWVVQMSGLSAGTINILTGLLLFLAISDLVFVKMFMKDTDNKND